MLYSGGGKGGDGGHAPRAALCTGRHYDGRKYGILKFGRFWRIVVCIADIDIFTPPNTSLALPSFETTPQLSVLHDPTQSSVYTKKLTLLI